MCGILEFIVQQQAVPILLDGFGLTVCSENNPAIVVKDRRGQALLTNFMTKVLSNGS